MMKCSCNHFLAADNTEPTKDMILTILIATKAGVNLGELSHFLTIGESNGNFITLCYSLCGWNEVFKSLGALVGQGRQIFRRFHLFICYRPCLASLARSVLLDPTAQPSLETPG